MSWFTVFLTLMVVAIVVAIAYVILAPIVGFAGGIQSAFQQIGNFFGHL
jgi:Flp pilus assembly pilin Flp